MERRQVKRRAAQAGQTLMEVLVALVIVAVGLGYLQIVSSGAVERGLDTASAREAQILARDKMEEILLDPENAQLYGEFEEHPGYSYQATIADEELTEEVVVSRLTLVVRYPTIEGGSEDAFGDTGFDDTGLDGEGVSSKPGSYTLVTFIPAETF